MPAFETLDWDSSFFGFGVARISPRRLESLALAQTLRELRQQRIVLAYWSTDPEDFPTQAAARRIGGFLADEKVIYVTERDLPEQGVDSMHQPEPYSEGWPNATLEKLALESGIYSRFRVDPRIPDGKFEDMYRTWIRESVARKLAAEVLVQRNENEIVGMVTLGIKEGRGDIGLIAVDGSARGQGVGQGLVSAALKWSFDQGAEVSQVVTQKANSAACRLYEKCGYRVERVDNVYHLWLSR